MSLSKFQDFVYGKEFVLETDHQPLQYLASAQFQNGRILRIWYFYKRCILFVVLLLT